MSASAKPKRSRPVFMDNATTKQSTPVKGLPRSIVASLAKNTNK